MRRRLWAVLLLILVLALPACDRLQPADSGNGVDLSDPDVGGGAGVETGPETPIPPATATNEASPRLDATTAALATFPLPSPTPTAVPPTVAPTEAPPEAPVAVEPTPTETPSPSPTETPAAEPEPSSTPETVPNEAGEIIHVVQPGENLYRIGLKYGISWVVIAEYNGIANADALSAGQELRIPPTPTPTPETDSAGPEEDEITLSDVPTAEAIAEGMPPADPAPIISSAAEDTVTVAAGDTLYDIARRYGISWEQVAEANGLAAPNQIFAGQVLKIPADVPGPTHAFTHQVRRGDTLAGIARQYGLATTALAEANGLTIPYVIFPGQEITIPGE